MQRIEPIGKSTGKKKKILLALLPFWPPLIPPLGIAGLKQFLQQWGYVVKALDVNVEEDFRERYENYFSTLRKYIPAGKRGNFRNIGKDVLNNHLMAYLHFEEKKRYDELVETLIAATFFCEAGSDVVRQLNEIVEGFFRQLEEYFTRVLTQEKPDVLGLSVYEGTLPASLMAAKLAKEANPGILTVMGGGIYAHDLEQGSPNWEPFLKAAPYIDTFIVGEGEHLFRQLLEGQLPEGRKIYSLEDIDHKTLDLGTAALPDFSDFDTGKYPYMAAYTSRGCPFQCKFCSETVHWGKYRKKKAGQIAAEVTALYQKYRSQVFLLCDSLLNPVVTELARAMIDREQPIYWDGYLRADKEVCTTENTLHWRRGGFYRARLGIESGAPRVLELMGKKITPQQIKDSISSLAYAGIKTTTYWVVGFPGETEDDFYQTLELIEELKNDIYEAWSSPFYYYPTGQVNSPQWAQNHRLLYPAQASDMLVIQTWIQGGEPSREETFRRLNIFVRHCRKLGIPNPFSLDQIHQADERWKTLHANAVPALVDFESGGTDINDLQNVSEVLLAKCIDEDDGDFDF